LLPVQERLKVRLLADSRSMFSDPLMACGPVQSPLAVHEVTFVALQERVAN
jgi:hypothetical protein